MSARTHALRDARQPSVDLDTSPFLGPVLSAPRVRPADVRGRRVAVVATSTQVVGLLPWLVHDAASTKVHVREVPWVLPSLPGSTRLARTGLAPRLGRAHLRAVVRDPELRWRLTPRGASPATSSATFLWAVQHPDCEVLVWPIARVTEWGIRSADGIERLADVIVLA